MGRRMRKDGITVVTTPRKERIAMLETLHSWPYTGKRAYTRAVNDLRFEMMVARFPWKV